MDSRIEAYMKQIPVLAEAAAGKEVFWVNSLIQLCCLRRQICSSSLEGRKSGI